MKTLVKYAVVILPIIAVGIKWDSRLGWLILALVAAFIITNAIKNEQTEKKSD